MTTVQALVFGLVSPLVSSLGARRLIVPSQTEPVEHEKPEERRKHQLAMRISVKLPKHPNTFELEKLQTHMPLFAHFFKEADLKVKDLEVESFFSPIGSQVRYSFEVSRGIVNSLRDIGSERRAW